MMKTVYTDKHGLHAPAHEFTRGALLTPFEKPSRAEYVLQAVRDRRLGEILTPRSFSHEAFTKVHDAGYVHFLKTIHAEYLAETGHDLALPTMFNVQHPGAPVPISAEGQLGYYIADTQTSLTATSWQAIEQSAFAALTAQQIVAGGDRAAFALCRPPGHHASRRCAGGYCFLNNAAIAAQAFLDQGASRVAVLDIDYHHGNGTQEIFYDRADVLFTSLHADPLQDYPFYLGHAAEKGAGAGLGFNLNYPLALGTDGPAYLAALEDSASRMRAYAPDALVVSLGVDTFENDPISRFKLKSADYFRVGAAIAGVKVPTVFVMEGGYDVAEIGVNAVNVLDGFLGKG